MKRAGVIGWPVAHSLSPVLHGYWLKQYGLVGKCDYELVPIPPNELTRGKLEDLRKERNYIGFNVTVPHKETAFALATDHRAAAQITGAANLLLFTEDGRIGADNTDGTGLVDSLEQALGMNMLRGKKIVMLGAGGAARGAIYALYQHGADVTVLNRHKPRAQQLVEFAKTRLPGGNFAAGDFDDWNKAAQDAWLVINTTSAGMKGNPPLAIDLGALPKTASVCDIVYSPLETPLLKGARERGLRAIDGLGMLMYQAAPSFQAFFFDEMRGLSPQVDEGLRAALVAELESRG